MNDFLPPTPTETTELSDELTALLDSLPPSVSIDSPVQIEQPPMTDAPTGQPPALSAIPIQPSISRTESALSSWTLSQLDGQPPSTVCAKCPGAVWQLPETGELRVYCRLLHHFVEDLLTSCDGEMIAAQMLAQN